jgi:hypothetical protein
MSEDLASMLPYVRATLRDLRDNRASLKVARMAMAMLEGRPVGTLNQPATEAEFERLMQHRALAAQ